MTPRLAFAAGCVAAPVIVWLTIKLVEHLNAHAALREATLAALWPRDGPTRRRADRVAHCCTDGETRWLRVIHIFGRRARWSLFAARSYGAPRWQWALNV